MSLIKIFKFQNLEVASLNIFSGKYMRIEVQKYVYL